MEAHLYKQWYYKLHNITFMQWHLILIIEKHENVYYIVAPVSLDQNERDTFYAAKLYNALCQPLKE